MICSLCQGIGTTNLGDVIANAVATNILEEVDDTNAAEAATAATRQVATVNAISTETETGNVIAATADLRRRHHVNIYSMKS